MAVCGAEDSQITCALQAPLYPSLAHVPCLITQAPLSTAAAAATDPRTTCPCDAMLIISDFAGVSCDAAALVADALNSLQEAKSIVVISDAALGKLLAAAGAVMLTPHHAADILRSSGTDRSLSPKTAAAVLDFLFKDHPQPPPPLDALPCLPGTQPPAPKNPRPVSFGAQCVPAHPPPPQSATCQCLKCPRSPRPKRPCYVRWGVHYSVFFFDLQLRLVPCELS